MAGSDADQPHSADALFGAALQQPDIRRQADENRLRVAELAERQDRNNAMGRMEQAAHEGSESDRLWVALYDEVLSERPVDIAVTRNDRYGAVDRDAAAGLCAEVCHGSMSADHWCACRLCLRPAAKKAKGRGAKGVDAQAHRRSFNQYVDATIAEVVEMLPPSEQRKREAERQAWMQQARRSRLDWNAVEQHDDHRMTVPDALPTAPLNSLPSVGTLDPRQIAMLEFAPHPAPQSADIARFFGPDGQPHGPLRDLLDEVQENRADYEVGTKGQLTAPDWVPDDRKNFQFIQRQRKIRELLVETFAQGAGLRAGLRRGGQSEGLER